MVAAGREEVAAENGFFDKFDSRVTARGTRRVPENRGGCSTLSQSLNQLNGWQKPAGIGNLCNARCDRRG